MQPSFVQFQHLAYLNLLLDFSCYQYQNRIFFIVSLVPGKKNNTNKYVEKFLETTMKFYGA
jgi:hypothetical protein